MIGKSSIYRTLKELGYAHITHKADMPAHEAFKKTKKSSATQWGKKIYFFDEARFGTHSKLGRAWCKKGSRTEISYKLGFKSFYMYTTGDSFTSIADAVNKNILQVFLDEFDKKLPKKVICVIDNAGCIKR